MAEPVATRYEFGNPLLYQGAAMDHANLHDPHVVTVEWRGGETWCVSRGHGWSSQLVWSETDDDWIWEPRPSERDDEFLRIARYPLVEALAIGARLAEHGPRHPRSAPPVPQGDETP